MNRNLQREAMSIVSAALDLPKHEVEEFIGSKCGSRPELRAEVDALLRSIQAADSFLETPPAPHVDSTSAAKMQKAVDQLARGDSVADRYSVQDKAGVGGMGEVYRATDIRLARDVALKILRFESDSDNMRARFEREFKTVAALSHTNIVTLYDVVDDRETQFAVLEWVDGATLRDLMDGPMDWRRVCDLAKGIASGLAAAHATGIMHRDIKPENVIVTQDGTAKILDFGLARPEAVSKDQKLTATTASPGTPSYMSPEQVEGAELRCATDVFSFGTVVYEMLIGANPFRAENAFQTMRNVCEVTPRPVSDSVENIPSTMQSLLTSMLDRKAEARPAASDLVATFESIKKASGGTKNQVHVVATGSSIHDEIANVTKGQPTIAVLPLQVYSSDVNHRFLGDAVAQEVIVDLCRLRSMFVIARGSSFQYRSTGVDLGEASRVLGAEYLVNGSIATHGDSAVVSVELSRMPTHNTIWTERFECPLGDIIQLRCAISGQIAVNVESRIHAHEADAALRLPTESLDAWSAYHRGLWHMYRFTPESNKLAREMFDIAVKADPRFARAHAGLSSTHWQDAFSGYVDDVARSGQLARRSSEESMELDALDPFVNLTMGRLHWLEGDLDSAGGWLDRTLELSPNYAFARYNRAIVDAALIRGEESEENAVRALANSPIDPFCGAFHGARALSYIIRGDYEQAVVFADEGARQPNSHVGVLAVTVIANHLAGRFEKARACGQKIRKISSDYTADDFVRAFQFQDEQISQLMKNALESSL